MTNLNHSKDLWDTLWKNTNHTVVEDDSLPELVCEVLEKNSSISSKTEVLEAGSGSGAVSLKLSKKNRLPHYPAGLLRGSYENIKKAFSTKQFKSYL